MYKEIIIIISIILSIFAIDRVTKNYLDETQTVLTKKLGVLKQETDAQNEKDKMDNLLEEWEKRYKIVSLYIGHSELDKIKTKLINMKSDIENSEKEDKNENIDEIIYLLDHIKETIGLW